MTRDFEVCPSCRKAVRLKRVYVALEYKGIAKELVYSLKFEGKRQAAEIIAKVMHGLLPLYSSDTIVVSVPTARSRVRQRGFDQTALIARCLAREQKLKFVPALLRHGAARQVGASKKLRQSQVGGLYALRPNVNLQGKEILLVDDVVTTGATLAEVTRVLKQAGAKSVSCAAFAYTK